MARRPNRTGKEIDNFVKTFLATKKAFDGDDTQKLRQELLRLQIAKLSGKSTASGGLSDDEFRQRLSGGASRGAAASGNAASVKGGDVPMKDVYNSFRNAGFSDNQARALTAEVGRENGFQGKYIFGTHKDPHNGATNMGPLSMQGDRLVQFREHRRKEGFLNSDGSLKPGQETRNAAAKFYRNEIETNPAYAQTKRELLGHPDLDPEKAAGVLGRNYIRWRMDDPKYASHNQTRRNYHARLSKELEQGEREGQQREALYKPGAVERRPLPPGQQQAAKPAVKPAPAAEEKPEAKPEEKPAEALPAAPSRPPSMINQPLPKVNSSGDDKPETALNVEGGDDTVTAEPASTGEVNVEPVKAAEYNPTSSDSDDWDASGNDEAPAESAVDTSDWGSSGDDWSAGDAGWDNMDTLSGDEWFAEGGMAGSTTEQPA